MRRVAHSPLLTPRGRPGRPVDLASRDARVARQRHRRLDRRALRALGRAFVLAAGLAALTMGAMTGIRWLLRAPVFAVATLEVVGTRRVSEATVREAAAVEPGTNLFQLDPETIEDRVEALPGIKRARLVRQWPNRVALRVEEREPYALVSAALGDGRLLWVDSQGYAVGAAPRPGVPSRPILSGADLAVRDEGGPPSDRLRTGLALLGALERSGSRFVARVSEIDLDQAEAPVIYTIDGIGVHLGRRDWDERLTRLEGVLARLDETGERVDWIDLRFRDQVVLRPQGAPVTAGEPTRRAAARPPATAPRPESR